MGQRQSSESNGAQEEAPAKTDYYELLGVERTATEEEIKKAYRRKALELHPDRNYGNVEWATKLFAEVQSAYEVLSDPQERAWYDSHRDILLRGDAAAGAEGEEFSYNTRMTTAEEVMKLMMKFNGRLEFSDAPSGFFGGLHEFFQQLAKEEDIACRWEDQEPLEYPDFGHEKDDYDDVVRPFYASWNGFVTRKSYAWKDQYRLSDAPDRRIRRLMEKENKKIREDAIQEYNEAVRSLVAFVRKRDPRVKDNQRSEAERQKALREATAAQAARSRAAREAKLQDIDGAAVPEWAQSRFKDEYEGGFSSESDIEAHVHDCVVCDKTFKSEAQFHAHERSKKHVKLLKQLQRDMRKEGKELDLEADKAKPQRTAREDESEGHDEAESFPADDTKTAHVIESDEDSAGVPVAETQAVPKGSDSDARSDDSGDDYAPRSKIEERLAKATLDDTSTLADDASLDQTATPSEPDDPAQPKMGKAKQRRAKKAAQAAVSDGPGKAWSEFACVICEAEFPSKTKLFEHIKVKGHAAPLSQAKAVSDGPGKIGSEFACVVCEAEFPSKTKLFEHIKVKGHAAPLSQAKGVKGAKSKKR